MPSACSQELAGLADVPLEFGGRIPLAHCPVRPVSSATALAMGGHAICNAASHHLLSDHSDTGCTFCLSSEFRSSSFGLEPIDTVQLHNAFKNLVHVRRLNGRNQELKASIEGLTEANCQSTTFTCSNQNQCFNFQQVFM